MEVTVSVRGKLMHTAASVCVFGLWLGTLKRQICPGEPCFLLPPRFISPTPSVAAPLQRHHPGFSPAPRYSVSDISHFENSLMSPAPRFDASTSSFSCTVTR